MQDSDYKKTLTPSISCLQDKINKLTEKDDLAREKTYFLSVGGTFKGSHKEHPEVKKSRYRTFFIEKYSISNIKYYIFQ